MLKYAILLAAVLAFAYTLSVPVEEHIAETDESDSHEVQARATCLSLDACYKNRRYYFEPSVKRKREDAANFCYSRGMALVSVEDCAENAFITEFIKRMGCTNDNYWTAGYQNGTINWYWTTTGRAFNYTNWKVAEPTNKKDLYCVTYRKDYLQWKNEKCSDKYLFICESNFYCNTTMYNYI